MYEYFQFSSPTKIVFGVGVSKDFGSELSTLGAKRVLLVSDTGINSQGFVERVFNAIKDAGAEVIGPYLDVQHNAPICAIEKLAEFGRKNQIDSIVAIGGGSVIDSAKAANILITHEGRLLEDYAGVQTVPSKLKPLIVIPTTAGTGSEVTSAAVVLDEKSGVKHSFIDDFLKPTVALLDPELTLKMPASLTSATAIDTFSHALEAFTSPMKSPISDALATEAIRLVKSYMIKVLNEPNNLYYRSEIMTAATIAGMAFDNAMVGVIHGIAHTLGGMKGLHHGEAIFMALPVGMKFNMEVAIEKYGKLAKRLYIALPDDDLTVAGNKFFDWMQEWRKEVSEKSNIALNFRDAGIERSELEAIAKGAATDGTSFYNPRDVDEMELLRVLEENY